LGGSKPNLKFPNSTEMTVIRGTLFLAYFHIIRGTLFLAYFHVIRGTLFLA